MRRTVKLGDILSLQNGYAFKSAEYQDDGYFVMRITNVQQGYISPNNPKYIRIDKGSKLEKFILEEGDILVSLTGDVGRVGVIENEHLPAALNQRVARVTGVKRELVNIDYLFIYMNSHAFRRQVEEFSHGAAQANVSTKDILSINVVLPPLAEQKRIVAKLDAAFAEIDSAIELVGTKQANAEKLKASLLDASLKDDDAMWKTVKLGDVCEIQPKKAQIKKKLSDNDEISFMPMDDLGINEMYPSANQTKTLAKAYSSYTYFEDNDVLLAKITPCFENGKLGIATNLTNGVGFGSSEYIVLRCGEQVLPQYIYYHLNQPSFRAEGKNKMSGAVGHKRVPKDFVESLKLPLPPLALQQRIVAKLDAAFAEIETVFATTKMAIDNYTALKSSLLKQELNPSEAA